MKEHLTPEEIARITAWSAWEDFQRDVLKEEGYNSPEQKRKAEIFERYSDRINKRQF